MRLLQVSAQVDALKAVKEVVLTSTRNHILSNFIFVLLLPASESRKDQTSLEQILMLRTHSRRVSCHCP
jgi:hypothetical protein